MHLYICGVPAGQRLSGADSRSATIVAYVHYGRCGRHRRDPYLGVVYQDHRPVRPGQCPSLVDVEDRHQGTLTWLIMGSLSVPMWMVQQPSSSLVDTCRSRPLWTIDPVCPLWTVVVDRFGFIVYRAWRVVPLRQRGARAGSECDAGHLLTRVRRPPVRGPDAQRRSTYALTCGNRVRDAVWTMIT